jgi:hypothetical protein
MILAGASFFLRHSRQKTHKYGRHNNAKHIFNVAKYFSEEFSTDVVSKFENQ